MPNLYKILYRSIPSNTRKSILFNALDSSTALVMFAAKYETSDLEVPPVDEVIEIPIKAASTPAPHAQNNLQ